MKQTILFLAANGGGLGHLTRSMAVAKRLRTKYKEYEIIFVTTLPAVELIRKEGFYYYYIPHRIDLPNDVNATAWGIMLSGFLQQIIRLHNPKAVVYDAAYPYLTILSCLDRNQIEKKIWIKREGYKPKREFINELENRFGLIIVPRELEEEERKSTETKKICNPIRFLEVNEAYDRNQVLMNMEIKKRERLVYLQLGTGIVNEIEDWVNQLVKELLEYKKIKILLAESPAGKRFAKGNDRVRVIRDYPNSRYFTAIDYAVSAAGYNTFYELLSFHVPAVYVPNRNTIFDDQYKRAMSAQQRQYGVCLTEKRHITESLAYYFSHTEEMKEHLQGYSMKNGAMEAAEYIYNYIENQNLG